MKGEKINWGLIGGGEDSQIGFIHRACVGLDGGLHFAAGALDIDPERARDFGHRLGLGKKRAYGSWQDMLRGEKKAPDPIALVTIATPNTTHFEISQAFLEAGFHVLCEKPMTTNVKDAQTLVEISQKTGKVCAVNYGYSGYPLVRHMRAMVKRGDLGAIRVVVAEFAGGFFANADDENNPRVRWRFDPKHAGSSAITADAGIHALHMACFVTDQRISSVSCDFATAVAGRTLEDDSLTAFRMEKGTIGRLWASGLAIGRAHGLTLQVFGEKGGLSWAQEQPNQLFWTPLNAPTQKLERGSPELAPEAQRANRIAIGHSEGMLLAFANIYRDLGAIISAQKTGQPVDPYALDLPTAKDGLHSIEIITAAVASAGSGSRWVKV